MLAPMESWQGRKGVLFGYALLFTLELGIFARLDEHLLGLVELPERLGRVGEDARDLAEAEKRPALLLPPGWH